ncbi:MAG: hypothetical protein ACXWP4_21960, partial [Polyangiales bacterium]
LRERPQESRHALFERRRCRPSADSTRLVCTDSVCTAAARRLAPAGFGGPCEHSDGGVDAAPDADAAATDEVIALTDCAICHVRAVGDGRCDACSMACTYDEDCPDGFVCGCVDKSSLVVPTRICLPARGTIDDRTTWLHCAP